LLALDDNSMSSDYKLSSYLFILLGTFAVISILVSKPTIEHCSGVDPINTLNGTFINQTGPTDDVIRCEMKVAVAVTFLSGVIQVSQIYLG
jgi:hypothetical protein